MAKVSCPKCGAVISGSTCDYCGHVFASNNANIQKTKNARKIKDLEKEIQKYQKEIDKINQVKNACLTVGFWIIGILVVVAIISLYLNKWRGEAIFIWSIVLPVFSFLLIFVCKVLDKESDQSDNNKIKKIREDIEYLKEKIDEIKNS